MFQPLILKHIEMQSSHKILPGMSHSWHDPHWRLCPGRNHSGAKIVMQKKPIIGLIGITYSNNILAMNCTCFIFSYGLSQNKMHMMNSQVHPMFVIYSIIIYVFPWFFPQVGFSCEERWRLDWWAPLQLMRTMPGVRVHGKQVCCASILFNTWETIHKHHIKKKNT